jgi:hypothetical protein
MNLFILMLFIPLSFAGSPPKCKELGNILEGFESKLQKDSIKDCSPDLYKTLVKNVPVNDPEFLKGKVCQELSTVEAQLGQLKTELAVMNGIHKLVSTVKDAKTKASAKKVDVAQVNAHTFVVSLNTAQSLEVLLQSKTEDGKPFMRALKEFDSNKLLNENDLKDRVSEICKGHQKSDVDACNTNVFNPGSEAATELIGMIKNSNPNDKQIAAWQKQLAIKRKDPKSDKGDYTFTAMQSELSNAFKKIDNKEVMSKQHLSAIEKLDDFEFDNKFNFVEDISKLKDQKKIKAASDKFFLLMGDAKNRQQYEVQSKVSIVWEDVKSSIPELNDEQRQQCSRAKSSYSDAALCIASLDKAAPNVTEPLARPKLREVLPALQTSVTYISNLEDKEIACREEIKNKEEVTEACYAQFNRDRAKLQDQILQLNIVKEKIGAQNVELMKLRNFALQKWTTQKCQSTNSVMDFCEDLGVITKDVSLTISDTMNIAIMFSPSEKAATEAEKEAKVVCDNDRKKMKSEDDICEFFYDSTSNKVERKPVPVVDGPILAPDGGNADMKIRDAWIQGAGNILQSVLPQYLNSQFAPVQNPYPYNYSPYNNGMPLMSTADALVFNARYYGGYGYYTPTPGYQPYTAFGASTASAYTPLSIPSTRYFTYK